MKIEKLLFIVFIGYLSLCSFSSYAAYFNSMIFEIDFDNKFTTKYVYNDTSRSNLYTTSVYKIVRPGNGQEMSVNEATKDLLWSPLRVMVQPNGKEYFKFFYRGPSDNIERYYRVVFKETPLSLFPFKMDKKNMDVVPVVSMSTILVVRPRNVILKYDIDEARGIIKNTGNTFFRVILQKGCRGNDESSKQFYMLPGEVWQGADAGIKNKKYIVAQNRYHHLGNGCFTSN